MSDATAVVSLAWEDVAGTPTPATREAIARAYGPDGIGLLVVTGVPDFVKLRARALPHAFSFATQTPETLARYEHEPSFFSFGWSHGKESFGGSRDTTKGSFYFNPLHDAPCAGSAAAADPTLAPFYHPNLWPTEGDAQPGFEDALKALGRAMISAGAALSIHVDAFVAERAVALGRSVPARTLHGVVTGSRTPKARLLYYFPVEGSGTASSSWCGAHNDHGSLTALTPAMFFDASSGAEVPCPDPAAGLYVYSRAGVPVKISVPADALAFQIGETAQVMSGGLLRATPHLVRAPTVPHVSRAALAVFMEPEHDERVEVAAGAVEADVLAGDAQLPQGVPRLGARWSSGDTFTQFTTKTLAAYY